MIDSGRDGTTSPPFGARQHRRTNVDPHDAAPGRVKWKVPTSANANLQQATRKALEEQRAETTIAAILEWKVKQVVYRRDPLVSAEICWHLPITSSHRYCWMPG
jgi:hypothetical protein